MELKIRRAYWLHHEGASCTLARENDRKVTALGYYLLALKVAATALCITSNPAELKLPEAAKWLIHTDSKGQQSLSWDALEILEMNNNPDRPVEAAENGIVRIFAKHDVQVTFI